MKKYIFDFDGTLVDSMRQWSAKMTNVLDSHNIPYPDNLIKIITPLGDVGVAEYFIKELGLPLSVPEILSLMDELAMKDYTYNIPAKDTVIETLDALKSAGFSLNVLTASPHHMLDVCLKRLGIFNLFENAFSCDDFNTTKSNPEIYHMVAERLGTTADNCVFLDDNINALFAAKSAGMEVIGVYDESSDEYKDEIIKLCDRYIYKFSELL